MTRVYIYIMLSLYPGKSVICGLSLYPGKSVICGLSLYPGKSVICGLSLYPGKSVICGLSPKTEAKSRSRAMTWISCEPARI